MTVEIDSSSIAKAVAVEVVKMIAFEIKRQVYPFELQGDSVAAGMIGISSDALKQRRLRGVFKKDKHYYIKNDKIIMWYRDALLDDWSLQNG